MNRLKKQNHIYCPIVILFIIFIGTFFSSIDAFQKIYELKKNEDLFFKKTNGKSTKDSIHRFFLEKKMYVSKEDIVTNNDSPRKVQLTKKACKKNGNIYVWIDIPINIPLKGKVYYDFCVSLQQSSTK